MQHAPETILSSWLVKLGLKVSPTFIRNRVKGHPDYPSLLSISDTLDELGIENGAYKITKNQLHEVPTPFLAHLNSNQGEFVIVENRDTLEKTYPQFFKHSTGVVVTAEKPNYFNHKENNQFLEIEKRNYQQRLFAIILITLAIVTAIILDGTLMIMALTIVALTGVFISWLIVSKELGIDNKIADRVCGKAADCDTVIRSKSLSLPFNVTWSDIGACWFASMLIILTLSSFAGTSKLFVPIFSLLSIAAFPFAFFSIYYQWRVIKKWCRLCLMILGLLFIQFAILFPTLLHFSWHSSQIHEIFSTASVLLMITVTWLLIKSLLIQSKKANADAFAGMRFKRNDSIFSLVLRQQRKIDFSPWESDLQLGNATAPLQIIIACGPFCRPCAQAHEKFHNFLENNANAGLTIRYALYADSVDSSVRKVVQAILQHIEHACKNMDANEKANYSQQVLQQWYKIADYEKFIEKYPPDNSIDVEDILRLHEYWTKTAKIKFTPTIFINGYEKPESYDIDSLVASLKYLNVEAIDRSMAEA